MSLTSTPIPKLSRNSVSPLANIKTLASGSADSAASNNRSPGHSPSQQFSQSGTTPSHSAQRITKSKQKSNSSDKSHPKGNILHVSNICPKMTYEQIKKGLYELFSIHGPIYEIVIKTKESGQHFAFVDFPDINHAEGAWLASKNSGKKLEGRPLMVNYCEDPSKNMDRKSSKCFLCHGTGHKAIRCPVKPEMIKPKPKKIDEAWSEQDNTNCVEAPQNSSHSSKLTPEKLDKPERSQRREKSERSRSRKFDEQSDRSSSESQEKQRDKDYLRFLKLKKRLLEQKLRKKVRKQRKKKN